MARQCKIQLHLRSMSTYIWTKQRVINVTQKTKLIPLTVASLRPLSSGLLSYLEYCRASIYFISSLFKVDLHLASKKPIHVNNNTAYISVNKLPSNTDNNKTEYLIVRKDQHVANRFYITYMGNQASTLLFFV